MKLFILKRDQCVSDIYIPTFYIDVLKYTSDILASARKRFRPGSASLALNHVVLPSSKYCLDFKTINMFFVYPVTNITIHVLNKLFLTIFWCISAVETTMPWCKKQKRDDVTIFTSDKCTRLCWGIDLIYSFDLLCSLYSDNERGSCRINKLHTFDYIDITALLYVQLCYDHKLADN